MIFEDTIKYIPKQKNDNYYNDIIVMLKAIFEMGFQIYLAHLLSLSDSLKKNSNNQSDHLQQGEAGLWHCSLNLQHLRQI